MSSHRRPLKVEPEMDYAAYGHNTKNGGGVMLGKQMTLFKLFGFEVRIDLSGIVIAVLLTWSLAQRTQHGRFRYGGL